MRGSIECPIHPTEDPERVLKAVVSLFPDTSFEVQGGSVKGVVTGETEIEWLRSRIFEQRIIDATRARLLANLEENKTRLLLDKQAGLYGRVRVIDDEEEDPPLGGITVEFWFDGPSERDAFLAWLTPPTKDGKVIE